MILDSTFLIDFARELQANRRGPARQFLAENRATPMMVSIISVGEVAAGMETNQDARDFIALFRQILNISHEAAYRAATIDRQLMANGKRLGENDNWIAAIAHYNSQPIVSNDDDFDRVPGLRRIAYEKKKADYKC